MNEKLQYATMLEIPVNTCSVTFKRGKKRKTTKKRKQNPEAVKQELLNKINSQALLDVEPSSNTEIQVDNQVEYPLDADVQAQEVYQDEIDQQDDFNQPTAQVRQVEKPKKRLRLKFSVIGVQFAVIGALIATIFLTNAFYADSGINVFLRSVFGTNQTQAAVDSREFDEFTPVIAMTGGVEISLENGVTTMVGEGSVYSPCDGRVSAITQTEDGKYTIEITHSTNFKSILSGIDYAYAGLDDVVFGNIPVGYVRAGATMCFKGGDGAIISDYQLSENTVIWAV